MSRHKWKKLSVSFASMFFSLIVSLTLIGFFGPKTGAPEGQRTLGIGPIWISRIHEKVTGNTHHWWTEVNWWVLFAVLVVSGAIGHMCARTPESESR